MIIRPGRDALFIVCFLTVLFWSFNLREEHMPRVLVKRVLRSLALRWRK